MTDLERFVRDRLEEDRAVAQAAIDDPEGPDDCWFDTSNGHIGDHYRRHSPEAVLADIEAKRALLDDITAAKHQVIDSDPYFTCNAATEERDGGESWAREKWGTACECGRDARVERRLKLMAAPYCDHPEYDPTWRTQ